MPSPRVRVPRDHRSLAERGDVEDADGRRHLAAGRGSRRHARAVSVDGDLPRLRGGHHARRPSRLPRSSAREVRHRPGVAARFGRTGSRTARETIHCCDDASARHAHHASDQPAVAAPPWLQARLGPHVRDGDRNEDVHGNRRSARPSRHGRRARAPRDHGRRDRDHRQRLPPGGDARPPDGSRRRDGAPWMG